MVKVLCICVCFNFENLSAKDNIAVAIYMNHRVGMKSSFYRKTNTDFDLCVVSWGVRAILAVLEFIGVRLCLILWMAVELLPQTSWERMWRFLFCLINNLYLPGREIENGEGKGEPTYLSSLVIVKMRFQFLLGNFLSRFSFMCLIFLENFLYFYFKILN